MAKDLETKVIDLDIWVAALERAQSDLEARIAIVEKESVRLDREIFDLQATNVSLSGHLAKAGEALL